MPIDTPRGAGAPMQAPTPERPVVERLHGQEIVDPFRYLENPDDPDTRAFITAENARTRAFMDAQPGRETLSALFDALLGTGALGVPRLHGGRLFYTRRDRERDQPVLYTSAPDGSDERILYDPRADDPTGLVSLDWWQVAPDGRRLVFGTSRSGDEWSRLRIRLVETGEELPDRIERARDSSVAFEPDGRAFYYTRYPDPASVPAGEQYFHKHVFRHVIGEPDDDAVFGTDRPREELPRVTLAGDGRLLLVETHRGWAASDLWLRDLAAPGSALTAVFADEPATFSPVADGDRVLLLTNLGAPRFRLLAAGIGDLAATGAAAFRELVAEDPAAVLEAVGAGRGGIVAVYSRDAVSEVRLLERDGRLRTVVDLPPLGGVPLLWAAPEADEAYLLFECFTAPARVYRLDTRTGALSLWRALPTPPAAEGIRARQVFATSRDGTRVPMFLLTGADLPAHEPPPQPVPAVLTGYGGFRITTSPAFAASVVPWLRRGGVYAVANLRGGLEYGETWHQDGMLGRKQNVFDDFIASAEYLVHEGYTRPSLLGIMGGSNGGLLVGAALTQRPDLFRAVRCAVPLLDMLRYHLFRLGGLWTSEYGSPAEPEAFAWLRRYSPYHNVRAGVRYPAVLFTTADSDSRVDPMHALKMAALLRRDAPDQGERPILRHVDTDAGHGAGKPVHKLVDDLVMTWSFLASQLDPERSWR